MPHLVSLTKNVGSHSALSSCTQSCTQESICKQVENVLRASFWIVFGSPTTMNQRTIPNARSQTTGLANFDDNEGHVVGQGAVAPSGRALEDGPFHFGK